MIVKNRGTISGVQMFLRNRTSVFVNVAINRVWEFLSFFFAKYYPLVLDAAEPLSAWSRYYISSVQILYPHGARNISARRRKFSCTAFQCRSYGGNTLFQRQKQRVFMVKVCCFHSENMLFSNRKKHFFDNYPLNFN